MIVDFYKGEYMLYDGITHHKFPESQDKNNYIFGQNIKTGEFTINTFMCIIQFSKKECFKHTGSDIIMKPSITTYPFSQKILTKTKKKNQVKDVYAIVKIDTYDKIKKIIYCNIVRYLGNIVDTNISNRFMEYMCTSHWKSSPDQSHFAETKDTKLKFLAQKDMDLTPDRKDMTMYEIYSIDPDGCRDIDDALHYQYIVNENLHEIGIHIADVTSFIDENSDLDKELRMRVETVYDYKKQPIHMIPESLSIDHISLLEGNTKRAFSIILKIDNNGDIVDVEFMKTFIRVTKNLSYDEAQNMLSENINLRKLFDLGLMMKKKDNLGFSKNDVYDTHQMVAVYMIYANKLSAEKISQKYPNKVLLRKNDKNDMINSDEIDISNIDDHLIEKYEINNKEKAVYKVGTSNCCHYGLNLKLYTHMTSPMRRYADIIVHRQLYNTIIEKDINCIDPSTLFKLNFYKKIYKDSERYMKMYEVIDKINSNVIEMEAFITMINDERESIRIFIPQMNIDCDYKLLPNQLRMIKKLYFEPNKVSVIDIETDESYKYVLFQKINVKLIITTTSFLKYIVEIL